MKDLDKKRHEFKRLTQAFQTATEKAYDMYRGNEMEDEMEEAYTAAEEGLRNLYFIKIKEIMEIHPHSGVLYGPEWFWAEWTPTDSCFWYVYGVSAETRDLYASDKDYVDGKSNRQISREYSEMFNVPFEKSWICIWRYGYDSEYRVVKPEDFNTMFCEEKGFSKEDIELITDMTTDDIWSNDPDGLIVLKG